MKIPLYLFLILCLKTHCLFAGDLRYTVKLPGLAKALASKSESDWIFCGDDRINLASKNMAQHFYVGPKKSGAIIQGLSGFNIFQWRATKTAKELNQLLTDAAQKSQLILTSDSKPPDIQTLELLDMKIDIPETLTDCLAHGPKTFQCGSMLKLKQGLRECCSAPVDKLAGFQIRWASKTSPNSIWRFRYYPGQGNSNLVAIGEKEPVRYCVTEGITFIRP